MAPGSTGRRVPAALWTTADVKQFLLEWCPRKLSASADDCAYTARDSYVTLLWCFERIHAGRRVVLGSRTRPRSGSPLAFLDDPTSWHVVEWHKGFPRAKERLEARLGQEIVDKDSRAAFDQLVADLRASGCLGASE
jgi:hypothetical protein